MVGGLTVMAVFKLAEVFAPSPEYCATRVLDPGTGITREGAATEQFRF
jgi:hypothetical protein